MPTHGHQTNKPGRLCAILVPFGFLPCMMAEMLRMMAATKQPQLQEETHLIPARGSGMPAFQ